MIGYLLAILAILLAIVVAFLAAGGLPGVKRTKWGRRPRGHDRTDPLAEETTPRAGETLNDDSTSSPQRPQG